MSAQEVSRQGRAERRESETHRVLTRTIIAAHRTSFPRSQLMFSASLCVERVGSSRNCLAALLALCSSLQEVLFPCI